MKKFFTGYVAGFATLFILMLVFGDYEDDPTVSAVAAPPVATTSIQMEQSAASPIDVTPPPKYASGPAYDAVCNVDERSMTDPQIKAHAQRWVGQRFDGWQAWVYDVTEYGNGEYNLELAMEQRGLFWSRTVVIENISADLATILNVEQPVTLSGRIDRVDTTFEVVCNPVYITDFTLTLSDGSKVGGTALAPLSVPEAAIPVTYLGDIVQGFGYSLSALAIEDPATRPGIFHEQEVGKRLVAVEFSVGNVSGEKFSSNVLYTVLVDTNGFLYKAESGEVEGSLELLDVNPGEMARGWAGFNIPQDAIPASLKYEIAVTGEVLQAGLGSR